MYEWKWDKKKKLSLPNADTKVLFKSLAEKLKLVFPELVFSNQTPYIKNPDISEYGRLISDMIQNLDILDILSYYVTMVQIRRLIF